MKLLSTLLFGAIIGVSAFAYSNISASAAIVCSGAECWHTTEAYQYPSEAHVIVHPDDWTWDSGDHYTWREHAGRGYWHGDTWEDF